MVTVCLFFAWEPLTLLYRGAPIEWVSVFKYVGTTIADNDVRNVPMQIAFANAGKADGITKSIAGSTVVLPPFRLVHLHQSLASSLATVNAAAWAPVCFLTAGWAEGEASFYAWLLGTCRGKPGRFRWRWHLLFHFPYETAVVLTAVAKLLHQMHTSPQSFLGALGMALWEESRAHSGAWMC